MITSFYKGSQFSHGSGMVGHIQIAYTNFCLKTYPINSYIPGVFTMNDPIQSRGMLLKWFHRQGNSRQIICLSEALSYACILMTHPVFPWVKSPWTAVSYPFSSQPTLWLWSVSTYHIFVRYLFILQQYFIQKTKVPYTLAMTSI